MAYIEVEHVWKRFLLRKDRADSVGQLLTRMIPRGRRKPPSEPFWALRDISIDMPPGNSFGIVGNNGSGKSTLLKILTRTMSPTEGHVRVHGRVSALVELGAGFHPDFTGRENVYLNASILGMGRRDIEQKMEEIIEFAEIRPFIDTPVKYYSSGMHARLGFAVATSVDPEILIVDEILAVGDEAFQQKCMDRIFHMKREGTSILLVSHDLSSIERLMDQAVWISKGEMQKSGAPREVILAYRQSLMDQNDDDLAQASESMGDKGRTQNLIRVVSTYLQSHGKRVDSLESGEPVDITVALSNDSGADFHGHVSLTVTRPDGLELASFSTVLDGTPVHLRPGDNLLSMTMANFYLTTGEYEVTFSVYDENGRRLDEWPGVLPLHVQSMTRAPGLLVLPHAWKVE